MYPVNESYIVKKLVKLYNKIGEFSYFLDKNRYIIDLSGTWYIEDDFDSNIVYNFVYEKILSLLNKVTKYKDLHCNNEDSINSTNIDKSTKSIEIKGCEW